MGVKQFKLRDFDGLPEVSLTLSVAKLTAAGWSLRKIQKHLKLRNHQNVAYHRDKAIKQRILTPQPSGWVLRSPRLMASQRCQRKKAVGKAFCRLTAKSLVEVEPVRVRWGKHAVKGVFGFRREPNWVLIKDLAHRTILIKPKQFVFYDGCVTLTVRSRSVRVDVFGLEGATLEQVLERAREVARVKLGDFMRDFGGVLREGVFRASNADWTLNRELSKPFLRFKPSLSDASHPKQVEVNEFEKDRIERLLDGSLEKRFARLESMFEGLMEKLNNVNNVDSVKAPDWRDRG